MILRKARFVTLALASVAFANFCASECEANSAYRCSGYFSSVAAQAALPPQGVEPSDPVIAFMRSERAVAQVLPDAEITLQLDEWVAIRLGASGPGYFTGLSGFDGEPRSFADFKAALTREPGVLEAVFGNVVVYPFGLCENPRGRDRLMRTGAIPEDAERNIRFGFLFEEFARRWANRHPDHASRWLREQLSNTRARFDQALGMGAPTKFLGI
jgi:hypothetical protein